MPCHWRNPRRILTFERLCRCVVSKMQAYDDSSVPISWRWPCDSHGPGFRPSNLNIPDLRPGYSETPANVNLTLCVSVRVRVCVYACLRVLQARACGMGGARSCPDRVLGR